MTEPLTPQLTPIIAGPILRQAAQQKLTFWLVTSEAFSFNVQLFDQDYSCLLAREVIPGELQSIQVGERAFINLINLKLDTALPENELLFYHFTLISSNGEYPLVDLLPDLVYPQHKYPNFIIKSQLNSVLHGSCRKPHFNSADSLVQLDVMLSGEYFSSEKRPALLMMTGDQIYADDVAGPMLVAVHQVIELLGLFDESWQGAIVNNSDELFASEFCYYQRQRLLPHNKASLAVYKKLFVASRKPIFTSVNAKNHLVTLAEVLAMYFLTWSPELWRQVKLNQHTVPEQYSELYQKELVVINQFSQGLSSVRRALAHIPCYMIFDDHDITDDWNLTRGWEEAAYGHPFSKQIIGNALVAYWLCQGWGNAPEKFTSLYQEAQQHFTKQGISEQMRFINRLFAWQQWHYSLPTTPKVVVLDTRTQRWRSESNANKPSGLMDWEALTEMQQELIDQPSIIMISAAPIYGVKMIETVQRIFSFFGLPLMVDAENWMAHSGTANVMLNIFRHVKTPPNFIILSGDVHYSFVYQVTHRFRRNSSKILQVTCSGLKNQFPTRLLAVFEFLNKYLYASYSPLNWFTKRRRMKIVERKPNGNKRRSLLNNSGIGLVTIADDAQQVVAEVITADGEKIPFTNP